MKARWLPPRGRLTRWASASGCWPLRPGQTSASKTRTISSSAGQRVEQDLDEAQAALALLVDQLERRDVRLVGADLAVADDPIAGELKPGELIA